MRINLKDFGGFLSSPELGKRIGISVLDSLRKEPENNVILDFSGVQGVNRHFCEEFISVVFRGVGFEDFKKRIVIHNQTQIVRMVFDSIVNQKKDTPVEGIDAVIGAPIHIVHTEKTEEVVGQKVEEEKGGPVKEPVQRVEEARPIEEKIEPEPHKAPSEEEKKEEKAEGGVKRRRGARTATEKKAAKTEGAKKTKATRTAKKEGEKKEAAKAQKKTESRKKK